MKDLETHLTAALAKVEPPEGFAGRVLQRASTGPQVSSQPRRRPFLPLWLAAAALLLVLGSSWTLRLQAQRRKQARDQAQLILALQIASHHLNEAFERLATTRENP